MNNRWIDPEQPAPGNGVDGETGEYLFPPMSLDEVLGLARGTVFSADHATELRRRAKSAQHQHLGLIEGVNPASLDQAGWGVIFPKGGDPKLKQALEPLLRHRREQAGEHFRELVYQPGESKQLFLGRHGAGLGPADPRHVPYYLMIVGGPREVPFSFQYQLDVQYGVGRLYFDGPQRYEKYSRYAQSVIDAESRPLRPARRAVLFGPCHPGDLATRLTHEHLVHPLAEELAARLCREHRDWELRLVTGPDAHKERLLGVLGGEETPSFLFSASHGVGFPRTDRRQRWGQGALLCQDWKGPGNGISPDCYVGARDVSAAAEPRGLLAFFFACYSAATPAMNDYVHRSPREPRTLAATPFLARLPQRLLSHPNGGALAVVGHVDRAWGYSFYWPLAGKQLPAFADAFHLLLRGYPIGWAMDKLNLRYAELASDVLQCPVRENRKDLLHPAALWTALLDARNYVILGDPAVRLPAASDDGAKPL